MNRIFIWLSGADTQILKRCTHLGRTEQIRFAGIGTLVLVPAVLGAVSMSYAVSTVTKEPRLYQGAGLVWGLVVLLIDRYLVSTVFKSHLSGLGGRIGAIVVRYIFALIVGIAVAHPFVLLWFDSSITQTIDQHRRDAVTDRIQQATDDKKAADGQATATDTSAGLVAQLDKQTAFRDCLTTLQTNEQSGRVSSLSCGSTSGLAQCGPRCAQIGGQIAELNKEIEVLNKQIQDARDVTQKARDRAEIQSGQINQRAADDVAAIENRFSYDYLARVDALSELEQRSPQVLWVTGFMILLFVFVDILPITMKISTPASEYEEIRDTLIMERQTEERANRAVLETGTSQSVRAAMAADAARIRHEMSTTSDVSHSMLSTYNDDLVRFEKKIREIRAEASDKSEIQADVERDIAEMRLINTRAWQITFVRMREFFKS